MSYLSYDLWWLNDKDRPNGHKICRRQVIFIKGRSSSCGLLDFQRIFAILTRPLSFLSYIKVGIETDIFGSIFPQSTTAFDRSHLGFFKKMPCGMSLSVSQRVHNTKNNSQSCNFGNSGHRGIDATLNRGRGLLWQMWIISATLMRCLCVARTHSTSTRRHRHTPIDTGVRCGFVAAQQIFGRLGRWICTGREAMHKLCRRRCIVLHMRRISTEHGFPGHRLAVHDGSRLGWYGRWHQIAVTLRNGRLVQIPVAKAIPTKSLHRQIIPRLRFVVQILRLHLHIAHFVLRRDFCACHRCRLLHVMIVVWLWMRQRRRPMMMMMMIVLCLWQHGMRFWQTVGFTWFGRMLVLAFDQWRLAVRVPVEGVCTDGRTVRGALVVVNRIVFVGRQARVQATVRR